MISEILKDNFFEFIFKSKDNLGIMKPEDELQDETIQWLKKSGSGARTVSQILALKDKVVYEKIDAGIKMVNSKALNKAAEVQKFEILAKDFSFDDGELAPTLKLRRHVILKKHAEAINSLYNEA